MTANEGKTLVRLKVLHDPYIRQGQFSRVFSEITTAVNYGNQDLPLLESKLKKVPDINYRFLLKVYSSANIFQRFIMNYFLKDVYAAIF